MTTLFRQRLLEFVLLLWTFGNAWKVNAILVLHILDDSLILTANQRIFVLRILGIELLCGIIHGCSHV